jgi:hypothetical protein
VAPDDAAKVSPMGMEGWHAMAEEVADGVHGKYAYDGAASYSDVLRLQAPSLFAGACG